MQYLMYILISSCFHSLAYGPRKRHPDDMLSCTYVFGSSEGQQLLVSSTYLKHCRRCVALPNIQQSERLPAEPSPRLSQPHLLLW